MVSAGAKIVVAIVIAVVVSGAVFGGIAYGVTKNKSTINWPNSS